MYLLDTNALIWTLTKPEMLTDHALDIITNYISLKQLQKDSH